MSEKLLTPIEIGLTAAIVAIEGNEPLILTASSGDGDKLAGLPFGPFDAVSHRTFEIGLRAWVEEQAGLRLGYVEQLYTFGDRGRHTEAGDIHVASIGYLALTRAADNAARAPGATFEPWYRFFPWEDWREAHYTARHFSRTDTLGCRERATGHGARAQSQGSRPAVFRHRGRALGRGARARPLRTALRSRTDRGSAAGRTPCGTGAQGDPPSRRVDALRSPADSGDRNRAAARQT
jgi:hypothetical protein